MRMSSVLSLLSSVIYDEYPEKLLINQLTDHFNFDHHFFLLDSAVDVNRFINTNVSTPQTLYVYEAADNVIGFDNLGRINSTNGIMIVAAENAKFEQLLDRNATIKLLQKQKKIGIFLTHHSSTEDLRVLFTWCLNNRITNTFATIYSNDVLNIFTFNPFGTVEILNITGSRTFDEYFKSINANFHQYKLRLGGAMKDNYNGNFLLTAFRLMNASYVEILTEYVDPLDALENGTDILNQWYFPTELEHLKVYPLHIQRFLILVPEALPFTEFAAYLKNVVTGYLIVYCLTSILASIAALIIVRFVKQKKLLVVQSMIDVFNLLMNNNEFIKYQRLIRAEVVLIVPLTFVGFFIANGFLSTLKSHLTRPIQQQQMNSIDELYDSNLRVIVHQEDWHEELVRIFTNPSQRDWDEKIILIQDIRRLYEIYDRNMSYLVELETADILLKIQKSLGIKGYHKLTIAISIYLHSYHVNKGFPFLERLNEIIHRIQSAGLYTYWLERCREAEEKNISEKNLKRLQNVKGTTVKRASFPDFIIYGWLAGFVVFICEILWRKNRRIVSEVW